MQAAGNAVDLASRHEAVDGSDEAGDESDEEDLFRPRAPDEGAGGGSMEGLDAMDCSCLLYSPNVLAAWDDPEAQQSLRNRFVTGGPPFFVIFDIPCPPCTGFAVFHVLLLSYSQWTERFSRPSLPQAEWSGHCSPALLMTWIMCDSSHKKHSNVRSICFQKLHQQQPTVWMCILLIFSALRLRDGRVRHAIRCHELSEAIEHNLSCLYGGCRGLGGWQGAGGGKTWQ